MSRSIWKGPFLDSSFFKNTLPPSIKIWSRGSSIPAFLIGQTVLVHNGKEFKTLGITREKVGFKFGEFIVTRTFTNKYKSLKGKKKK